MTDSNQSTPGVTELRNNALMRPVEPDVTSPLRSDGELWVNTTTLQLYVFSTDLDGNGTRGWIGVTSGQNNGSIIYSGPNPPTLAEVYPNLEDYNIDMPLDPLPGTAWFDTNSNQLKIYWVTPASAPITDDAGVEVDPYNATWVSVTTAHYLTEATASLINDLQTQVDDLTQTVADLEVLVP